MWNQRGATIALPIHQWHRAARFKYEISESMKKTKEKYEKRATKKCGEQITANKELPTQHPIE